MTLADGSGRRGGDDRFRVSNDVCGGRQARKIHGRYVARFEKGIDSSGFGHHLCNVFSRKVRIDFGRFDIGNDFIHDALNPVIARFADRSVFAFFDPARSQRYERQFLKIAEFQSVGSGSA